MPPVPLGLRLLRAAPTRLVLELAALAVTVSVVQFPLKHIPFVMAAPTQVGFAIFTALAVPATLAVYVRLVRRLERRPVVELATTGALGELGWGLLGGAALFSATIGIIALLGGYHVHGTEPPTVLVAPVTMAVESGFIEELLFRGVIFRILEEWLGTWAALVISSALFGFVHLHNPHATLWSAAAIALEAGTMLGAAYMLTRRLWLAIGVHAAWNYTQGAIFGVAVSGFQVHGLLRGTMSGPAWLSGGEFGAESSVVALICCSSLAAWFLFKVIRANGVMPPSWVRARRGATAAAP